MLQLSKMLAIVMLITSSEGGMNTIFSPYLESLGLPVNRIGFVVSLFGVMQLVARLPSGALYTGHRAKALIGGALALLGLSTVGFAYGSSSLHIFALTLLHGFAFGAATTVMLALTIEAKPQGYSHGMVMGWYTASISAGYALGNSLGGILADRLGFQLGFIILGMFPLLGAILAGWLPRIAAHHAQTPAITLDRIHRFRSLRSSLNLSGLSPTILLAALAAFYINFLDDAVSTFFPLFGLSIGLSLTTIGSLRSAKSLAATGIRPVSGSFFKYVNYRWLNNAAILLWSVVVFLFPAMRLAWIFLLAFIMAGFSRGLIRVTSATMVAEAKSEDSGRLGLASGIYNAGLDLGAFAGPVLGGVLASIVGIPAMFRIVPPALLLAYFSVALLVTRTEKRVTGAMMAEVKEGE